MDQLLESQLSTTERKQLLIAQGAALREQVVYCRELAHANMQPGALLKGALFPLAATAFTALRSGGGAASAGLNLQSILPLILTAASTLSKKSFSKPALRTGLIIGTVAAAALLIARYRKQRAPT